MPTITVEGPMVQDVEKKRSLAKRLTDVAVEVYGIPHITVLIKENRPENVAADGVLIADLHKPAAAPPRGRATGPPSTGT